MKYIWLVTPPGYPHNECNAEWAESFRLAFKEIYGSCKFVRSRPDGAALVIGGQLIREETLPKGSVILQLEQVGDTNPWLSPGYLAFLQSHDVWDYSLLNTEKLKAMGIHATHCELGYMPCLTRIPQQEEDIDILFSGSMNERRVLVLNELVKLGKNVLYVQPGLYGEGRDRLMARAKIIINIHFYDAKVFEIGRCGYAMANRKCIVSETGYDEGLEGPYKNGSIAWAQYDGLVNACVALLDDDAKRKEIADTGFKTFSSRSQVEIFKNIIAP